MSEREIDFDIIKGEFNNNIDKEISDNELVCVKAVWNEYKYDTLVINKKDWTTFYEYYESVKHLNSSKFYKNVVFTVSKPIIGSFANIFHRDHYNIIYSIASDYNRYIIMQVTSFLYPYIANKINININNIEKKYDRLSYCETSIENRTNELITKLAEIIRIKKRFNNEIDSRKQYTINIEKYHKEFDDLPTDLIGIIKKYMN